MDPIPKSQDLLSIYDNPNRGQANQADQRNQLEGMLGTLNLPELEAQM